MNEAKVKGMHVDMINKNRMQVDITINSPDVEATGEFSCLELYISNHGCCSKEIRSRVESWLPLQKFGKTVAS